MQKLLGFLFSRQMLAITIVVVLAVIIWFIGPYLAFGGLHPLDTVLSRVTLIVLLLAALILYLKGWTLSPVGILVLCLLFWQATPLFSFGESHPFTPVWVRAMIIGVILLIYALYGLYRLWMALRVNEHLLQKILHPRSEQSTEAKEELRALNHIIIRAINQLKLLRPGTSLLRRLFENHRYLYELPWFIIIGSPGDGKSTALLNAGLQFPLSEQMGLSTHTFAGQGGTLNCDWWFTNEAVLIDTAGRYTRHDDSGSVPATQKNKAEWQGFLGLLRKYRSHVPINGALLTLNVVDLINQSDAERITTAAALRSRLAELRQELGIRFPVYLMVTKMDVLPGFSDYFSSLTAEARAQVWGFTLPFISRRKQAQPVALRPACAQEMMLLTSQLEQGVTNRLLEEYDVQHRRSLYRLPQEFAALTEPLLEMIGLIFLESKFDATQLHNMLRGIYFTSAVQASESVVADKLSLTQRFWRIVKRVGGGEHRADTNLVSHRSYFLHDLLSKLVFRESHLVQPNLQWEMRHRLTRWSIHSLLLILTIGLYWGMHTSYNNNADYLSNIRAKTTALKEKVQKYSAKPTAEVVPDLLLTTQALAAYPSLDPESPAWTFRYGLYRVPPIIDNTAHAYDRLLEQLLLPYVVQRVEQALDDALLQQDSKATYDALRVYLLLTLDDAHQDKFNGQEIQDWLIKDLEQHDSAVAFGGRSMILEHLSVLFDGSRVVHFAGDRNEPLIKKARVFLEGQTSTERIYDRAKIAMNEEASEDFTLTRAVGADAGTLFVRASGEPLDRGIPSLFTHNGYRNLFDKRLPEFVSAAWADDQWVMGRETVDSRKKAFTQLSQHINGEENPLAQEVRRLYLTEYTSRWQAFLADIHTINSTGTDISPSLAFDLQVLRGFTAPDSPLRRLATSVAEQTTLVMPMDANQKEKILAERAESRLTGRASQTVQTAKLLKSMSSAEQAEKTLVDDRFAALREVVKGRTSSGEQRGSLQLDAILSMLNAYYSQLMVADNALASNALPPALDASTKLRLEAAKLPAPFQNIILDLTAQGARKLNLASGEVLNNQMEAMIGSQCRDSIDGRYPLADSEMEVSVDDFNRVFATGGLLDDFFTKQLAPYTDISTNPWRYRGAQGEAPIPGPDLAPFRDAKSIREAFFSPATHKLSWSMDIKVVDLDPMITDLTIDIDGQVLRYAHGPVRPLHITWPGPRNGSMSEIFVNPRIRQDTSALLKNGSWALLHLLDAGHVISSVNSRQQLLEYDFDGRKVILEITSSMNRDLLTNFSCPEQAL